MRGGRWSCQQRLHAPQARGQHRDTQTCGERIRVRRRACQFKAQHAAGAAEQFARSPVLRVSLESRVIDPTHRRVRGEEACQCQRALVLEAHPQRQRLEPALQQKGRVRIEGDAPLLLGALFFILAVGSPDFPGQGFRLAMLVFVFVFIAGVFADLLETRQGRFVAAGVGGLLGAAGLWNVLQLLRLR